VPSSRFTLITWKTLVSLPTDYASSGSGSVHRIDTYAELATAPTQLTSSRACHRHVTGTDLTQFDADAYVLARTAEVMAQCYTAEVAPPNHTYFFCASLPALQAVQNPRSIKAHSYALRFHCVLTTLLFSS
jgi:hypothetical protein